MSSSNGFRTENSVIAHLRNYHSYKVEQNDTWDHKHKIDFIVLIIPNLPIVPTGVQITEKTSDYQKMNDFLLAHRGKLKIVDRAIYMEIEPSVPIDSGGGDIVASVIKQFRTDRGLLSKDAIGVHIFPDLSYEFFDLEDKVKKYIQTNGGTPNITGQQAIPNPSETSVQRTDIPIPKSIIEQKAQGIEKVVKDEVKLDSAELRRSLMGDKLGGRQLRGVLNSFLPTRGFGRALSETGEPFFVHVYNIVDSDLRERLGRLHGSTPVNVEEFISFIDGGKTKPDARYNEAKQVSGRR